MMVIGLVKIVSAAWWMLDIDPASWSETQVRLLALPAAQWDVGSPT